MEDPTPDKHRWQIPIPGAQQEKFNSLLGQVEHFIYALNQLALKAHILEMWDPSEGAQGAGQQQSTSTK